MPETSNEQMISQTRRASRQLVRELGFLRSGEAICSTSFAQCHALIEIEEHGSATTGELADLLKVDKSAMSRTVKQMLESQLIAIKPDPFDSRRRPLVLTEKGRTKLVKINNQVNGQVKSALNHLQIDEQKIVEQGLRLYAKAMAAANLLAPFSFRKIKAEDDPFVADIIRKVMPEFGAIGDGFAIQDSEVDTMFSAYSGPEAVYFVVEYLGKVVAGAGIAQLIGEKDNICELRKMYMLPEVRGKGVGKELLTMCLDAARKFGYQVCYLETLERMHQARGLYNKSGFTKLTQPMGATGHHGCDSWYSLKLV